MALFDPAASSGLKMGHASSTPRFGYGRIVGIEVRKADGRLRKGRVKKAVEEFAAQRV